VIIPIGHEQPLSRFPYVTVAIIAICTLIQIYSQVEQPSADALRGSFNADPAQWQELYEKLPVWRWGYHTDGTGSAFNLLLCSFVHAGWFHLIGNMVFLFIVGSAVEDELGPVKFIAFYLAGALLSTLAFVATFHGFPTILVGASGAISAVMGAFLCYFTKTRIQFAYWFLSRGWGTFYSPAYVALPLWLAEQILLRTMRSAEQFDSVAYESHIGGFIAGFAMALVARKLIKTASSAGVDASPAVAAAIPTAVARTRNPGVTLRAPVEREVELSAPAPDRYDRLLTAMRDLDMDEVKRLASRVILDLQNRGEVDQILDIYEGLGRLPSRPLTDGAFAAAARAAEARGRSELRAEIIAALYEAHPHSALIKKRTTPPPTR
jgi:membrane associated rhomboid family serine protease